MLLFDSYCCRVSCSARRSEFCSTASDHCLATRRRNSRVKDSPGGRVQLPTFLPKRPARSHRHRGCHLWCLVRFCCLDVLDKTRDEESTHVPHALLTSPPSLRRTIRSLMTKNSVKIPKHHLGCRSSGQAGDWSTKSPSIAVYTRASIGDRQLQPSPFGTAYMPAS